MLNVDRVFSHSHVLCEASRAASSTRASRCRVALLVALCLYAAQPVAADVITFQDQPLGPYADETVTIAAGGTFVQFSGRGLQIRDIQGHGFPDGASRVLSTIGDIDRITATFAPGFTTNFVQVRNWISGTFSGEVDTIVMSAFDASRSLLGTVVSSNDFVSVSFPGIAMVTFDDPRDREGYVIDDFTFGGTPVPEPGSLLLMGAAVAGLVARRRSTRSLTPDGFPKGRRSPAQNGRRSPEIDLTRTAATSPAFSRVLRIAPR